MRKFLVGMMLWAFSGVATAQTVTVEGMGLDKDSAVRDASRLAVEQVAGTLIDARSLMKDLTIELDEVYKKSQGFIRKVDILDEGEWKGNYRVKARIDVDTDPKSALMDNLTMLMRLNDPRIAVAVLNGWNDDSGRLAHNEELESALQAKLLEMNFTHVLDAEHSGRLFNTTLLDGIYEGNKGLSGMGSDNACEFLVLGKVTSNTMNVAIPDHRTGQMTEAPLVNAKAKLVLKVIKYDTGNIIGTYTIENLGIGGNNARAFDTALVPLAEKAAGKLAEVFRGFSAKSSQGGLRITINGSGATDLETLINDLRSLPGVDNLYIRSQKEGQIVVELETMQKPHTILTLLRSRSKANIAVESATANTLVLQAPGA